MTRILFNQHNNGSFLMYILPTIYTKSCRKKKNKNKNRFKLQTQIERENKKEPINPLTPKNFESTALHCFDLSRSRQSGCSAAQPISQFRFSCFFVFLPDLGFWAAHLDLMFWQKNPQYLVGNHCA